MPAAFEADLVVLAPIGPPLLAPDLALDLEHRGHAHLLAGVRETSGIVGPLVVPTVTACLHCQHLHRHDRDPDWPRLALQLVRPRTTGDDPCDVTLASLVAALAAMQALDYLDASAPLPRPGHAERRPSAAHRIAETKAIVLRGETPLPATANGSLEFAVPGWQVARRSWPVHPNCPCRTARRAARAAPPGVPRAGTVPPRPGGRGDPPTHRAGPAEAG